jgi:hypothetical protein
MKISLEGPISENTELFSLPIKSEPLVEVDMQKVTFINSIGVKNWITWTNKIPSQNTVELQFCPTVIANQASSVHGFLPKNFYIKSFYAPFLCPDCSKDTTQLLERGKHFEFATKADAEWVKLPEKIMCPKCKNEMEPDFVEKRMFAFLRKNLIEEKV